MTVKINKLEIENTKRVKAVRLEPTPAGLTVIGGKNNQGKTSVLDAIAWALGGDKYRPSDPQRDGSVLPPNLHVELSNGLVVERKGKNASLKVIDPEGHKGGQQLLNEFVEQLAIDLPRFMVAGNREKAETLLQIIGVGEQLFELEHREQELYNKRHAIGQIADQKEKYAREMEYYPDAPDKLISASELIQQQQMILAQNGENQLKRQKATQLETVAKTLQDKVTSLQEQLKNATDELNKAIADLDIARKSAIGLQDESTEELENNITQIEAINVKVRANLDKEKAEDEAEQYRKQYDALTVEIEDVRLNKMHLLNGADLPLPGLSVADGELTYKGRKWDNMSGSDQLKVSTAIVRKLNPKCGFVLLDKLEQIDVDTMTEFGQWLEAEGLQAIATRVSTGDECSIIIEDGYVKGEEYATPEPQESPKWQEGVF